MATISQSPETTGAVRLACCQTAPQVGDPAGNRKRAERAAADAFEAGARIVVLPELSNSGYAFADAAEARWSAEPVDGPTVTGLAELSAAHDGLLIAGLCELDGDGAVRNSAVALEAGELVATYRKVHLWGHEQDHFRAGEKTPPIVETRFGRVGIAVCYDLEFVELTRGLALGGADLLALPTNWPRATAPPPGLPMLSLLAAATARLSRVFVAICDRSGVERESAYEGGSVIADVDGVPLVSAAPGGGEETIVAELDLTQARDKRLGERNDVFEDRRPGLYSPGLLR
jgi:5-aminopentanamidase